jgi:hypothetical protein
MFKIIVVCITACIAMFVEVVTQASTILPTSALTYNSAVTDKLSPQRLTLFLNSALHRICNKGELYVDCYRLYVIRLIGLTQPDKGIHNLHLLSRSDLIDARNQTSRIRSLFAAQRKSGKIKPVCTLTAFV